MKKYYWLFILLISNYTWANRYMEDSYDGYTSNNYDFIGFISYFCFYFWAYISFFKVMNNKAIVLTAIGSFLTTIYIYKTYFHTYDSGIMGALTLIAPFAIRFIFSRNR